MSQILSPVFPKESASINGVISFVNRDEEIFYFQGGLPIFCHPEGDLASFRMFCCQLVEMGNCKQVEIATAFEISKLSVKRWIKKYRKEGPSSFFQPLNKKRKSRILTPEILKQAQGLLNEGLSRSEVAKELELKPDTLSKAVRTGRLVESPKKKLQILL